MERSPCHKKCVDCLTFLFRAKNEGLDPVLRGFPAVRVVKNAWCLSSLLTVFRNVKKVPQIQQMLKMMFSLPLLHRWRYQIFVYRVCCSCWHIKMIEVHKSQVAVLSKTLKFPWLDWAVRLPVIGLLFDIFSCNSFRTCFILVPLRFFL